MRFVAELIPDENDEGGELLGQTFLQFLANTTTKFVVDDDVEFGIQDVHLVADGVDIPVSERELNLPVKEAPEATFKMA